MSLSPEYIDRIEKLNSIGISLSSEKDTPRLLEKILLGAKAITRADGGTLYLINENETHLNFAILNNDTLKVSLGGTTGKPVVLDPIPLYDEKGAANTKTVAAYAALTGKTVNIPDVYTTDGFDFSGTKRYDDKTGYRSVSFLTIPMTNHENEVIGVLQLINAKSHDNITVPFTHTDQRLAESLASQAAVALTNHKLIEGMRELLERFIELIASAIDEKSPYTGSHCRRIPELAMMFADAIQNTQTGPMQDVKFTEKELYELKIAALMHDCGKITTPVHVQDKATKLETIYNRLHTVDARFQVMKHEAEIHYLKARLQASENNQCTDLDALQRDYQRYVDKLEQDRQFLHQVNLGGEFMEESAIHRVHEISAYTWKSPTGTEALLTEDEVFNLTIPKGTLNSKERAVINNHIIVTQKMLNSLPFPKHLKQVPEIAGNHHERIDGKGYPRGLTRDELSIRARLMCICDIFEALTASDRPYKKPMRISQALHILGRMANEGHIDPELFDVFVSGEVYLQYAERFLSKEQIDEVDAKKLPRPVGANTRASPIQKIAGK